MNLEAMSKKQLCDLVIELASSLQEDDLHDPETYSLISQLLDILDDSGYTLPQELINQLASIDSPEQRFLQAVQILGLQDPSQLDAVAHSMKNVGLLKNDHNIDDLIKATPIDITNNHILFFPAKIKGQVKDAETPGYHVTLKWMGVDKPMDHKEVQKMVDKYRLHPPKPKKLVPTIWNSPRGDIHVLKLEGDHDNLHHAHEEMSKEVKSNFPFVPHITVSKELHDSVPKEGIAPEALGLELGPLQYHIGHNHIKDFHPAPTATEHYTKEGISFKKNLLDFEEGYRGTHKAPTAKNGSPLHNATGAYPEDLYSDKGFHYYGEGDRKMDKESIKTFHATKGNPEAIVKIYRAIPKGVNATKINRGDWVTANLDYAHKHGSRFEEGYDIIHHEVPAKHLFTDGNSLHEFGYDPGDSLKKNDSIEGMNKDFFDKNGKLKKRVRDVLLDVYQDVMDDLKAKGHGFEPAFVILTGSLMGPGYDDKSDVDFHIGVDFEHTDIDQDFLRYYAKDFNSNKYTLMGRDLEIYFQDAKEKHETPGIYDVCDDHWIKAPTGDKIEITEDEKVVAQKYLEKITKIRDSYKKHKKSRVFAKKSLDKTKALHEKIRSMRKKSILQDGEKGFGNQVFKLMRRNGALEILSKLIRDITDDYYDIFEKSEMALNEIKKKLKEDNVSTSTKAKR